MFLKFTIAAALVVIAAKLTWQSSESAVLRLKDVETQAELNELKVETLSLRNYLKLSHEQVESANMRYNRLREKADLMEDQITQWEFTVIPRKEEHAATTGDLLAPVPTNRDGGHQSHP